MFKVEWNDKRDIAMQNGTLLTGCIRAAAASWAAQLYESSFIQTLTYFHGSALVDTRPLTATWPHNPRVRPPPTPRKEQQKLANHKLIVFSLGSVKANRKLYRSYLYIHQIIIESILSDSNSNLFDSVSCSRIESSANEPTRDNWRFNYPSIWCDTNQITVDDLARMLFLSYQILIIASIDHRYWSIYHSNNQRVWSDW